MPLKMFVFFLISSLASFQSHQASFKYNGFLSAPNMTMDGLAQITPNGLLRLTNTTTSLQAGSHAFHSFLIPFKHSSSGAALSFSTTFVMAIVPPTYHSVINHGIAFVISPSRNFTSSFYNQYLGLFNTTNNGNPLNHIVAVEFDTIQNPEFRDIDDNHVGIDINSLTSVISYRAGYFSNENGGFVNIRLGSGNPIQVWVEYSGLEKQLNVTISPIHLTKPKRPLLSLNKDLSPIIKEFMYVGFSSSTGRLTASQYVLGWSFKMNGQAEELDFSRLPKLPRVGPKEKSKVLTIGVPSFVVIFMLVTFSAVGFIVRRKIKYAEVLEDWESEYGPHRFSYEDLFKATKGFRDTELLGIGGFGMVYKGVLPSSHVQVAVKKVSHKSKQGMREFIAEIVSLGRLRHRNLVQLLGYCRRKTELLLVYDFMPNGSLDKYLFDEPIKLLSWPQRFQIIKGVASGLLYLHEEWEKIVLHRDIKASNVLLDSEFNGRLGDFGLARLYDHGSNPQTTHIVGTLGYIAPELTRKGKATTQTDVFAFGVFLLEVACGKRPIGLRGSPEEIILVDWVLQCWERGEILEARDVRLGNEFVKKEVELALKLGLLCSHPTAAVRPGMRQVMQFLEEECPLPELPFDGWKDEMLGDMEPFYPWIDAAEKASPQCSSSMVAESLLSGGR